MEVVPLRDSERADDRPEELRDAVAVDIDKINISFRESGYLWCRCVGGSDGVLGFLCARIHYFQNKREISRASEQASPDFL
mmetsp:Transcript_52888/g.158309  ORF Transcript_52888/g.158309 Transcript_52888/m.158309 type:complete len:81 (+) Transcript_52888:1290-1532(+)